MREIGQMDRRFLVDDAALLRLGLALMALDHIDAAGPARGLPWGTP